MGYGDDLDGLPISAIDDEISAHRSEQEGAGPREVGTCVPHAREGREVLELGVEGVEDAIGRIQVVSGDVFPDAVQVRPPPGRTRSRSSAASAAASGASVKFGADRGGIDTFSAVEGSEASVEFCLELGELGGPKPLVLLEEPERLPDDFTGGCVPPGLHFGGDECFQLGGQRDIHGSLLSVPTLP